ncbi:IS3 family transposase [Streptomyces sp. NPDC005780]|uniref:IS3 family transposase n=1 Tax=Streptomyces sp. NPDC005780 TaxID=3364730 RepID=UPI0036B61F27
MGTARYSEEFKQDAVKLVASTGRSVNSVAKDLGVNTESLRQWVRAAEAAQASGGGEPMAPVEREELKRLRKQVRELELEKEILKKAAQYFEGDGSMTGRWRFISDHHMEYGIQRLCRVFGVSRSGFYRWRAAGPARAARAAAEAALTEQIRGIHTGTKGAYGVPRITRELRESGPVVNHKQVARLMRAAGIIGRHLRKGKRTTVQDARAPKAPDLVRRDFTAPRTDVRWCGDIAYLAVGNDWMYLATVIDMHSRRVVGWSMAEHMRADLVINALEAAVATRGRSVDGVVFHSDRGTQYTSDAFALACRKYGIRRSMGRVGSSYDNAMAESFFASIKRELLHGERWRHSPEARMAVFSWLAWCNNRRRHSALGQLSPVEFERKAITSRSLNLAA